MRVSEQNGHVMLSLEGERMQDDCFIIISFGSAELLALDIVKIIRKRHRGSHVMMHERDEVSGVVSEVWE